MNKNINKIIFPLIIILFLVVSMIYYFCNMNSGYSKYKNKKREDIVYTYFKEKSTYIPHINLDSDVVTSINDLIINKANDFLGKNDKNVITYTYELNGKILSLAIQYISMEDVSPVVTYDVYNIRVTDSHLLDNNEVLELFSVSEEQVIEVVESKFKSFYVDLFEKRYFDEECSYECFLYMRGMKDNDYLENSSYYIKNGDLYVLRPFNIYSSFNEEDYFTLSDFLIQITE